ncbi:MAG TPA: glycogen synthase GlgA [Terriglobales bacterium]|nr:glycogen synthase GlgA [Terriglobales bacterium]
MRITFAASEGVPYSKTGGLADVVGALPKAVSALGHDVAVFLPRYRQTRLKQERVVISNLTVPMQDYLLFCQIIDGGKHDGVQFYFVDHPEFTFRDGLYGDSRGDYPDNAERFTMFCRAVIESSKRLGPPDIFHVHDWQTSLIPVLLRTQYANDTDFAGTGTVLTIHNIGYQGVFPNTVMPKLLLPWSLFTMDRLEFYDKVNFLKGGIIYSDYITTVSRTYAREIQTKEYGFGLADTVYQKRDRVVGIVNGVDYGEWNPETERYIPATFSSSDLSGKVQCKSALLDEYGMSGSKADWPVVGVISRFAAQKGFDLMESALPQLLTERMVLLVLGTGEAHYEAMFRTLHRRFPDRLCIKIAYDNRLAHLVEAGSDIFLMPSHYEPCGLTQIYSMRYGTVPVVRATGGLEDTVEQWNPKTRTGTGFKFTGYTPLELRTAMRQALAAFQRKEDWKQLMLNGMRQNFSWDEPAREYVTVYEHAHRSHTLV